MYIISYFGILFSLMALDWVWLGVITKNIYNEYLGHLFRTDFVWPVIILFYVLYAAGILYFVVLPAEGNSTRALLTGLFFGFTAYMTYDLVNYATIQNWPLRIVFIDIAWGCVITALAAMVGALVYRK